MGVIILYHISCVWQTQPIPFPTPFLTSLTSNLSSYPTAEGITEWQTIELNTLWLIKTQQRQLDALQKVCSPLKCEKWCRSNASYGHVSLVWQAGWFLESKGRALNSLQFSWHFPVQLFVYIIDVQILDVCCNYPKFDTTCRRNSMSL